MMYVQLILSVLTNLQATTWCLLLLPLLVLLVAIIVERSSVRRMRSDGIWRALGTKWKRIGLLVIIALALLYALDVLMGRYRPEYDRSFQQTLEQRTSKLGDRQVRANMVGRAAARMDEGDLRERAMAYALELPPDTRLQALHAVLISNHDGGLIDWAPLLSPSAGADGHRNFAENTTLPIDEQQRRHYDNKQWERLWSSLRPEQWSYMIKQVLQLQGHGALVDIMKSLVLYMPPVQSIAIAKALYEDHYPGRHHVGDRLAAQAGATGAARQIFPFLVRSIFWLRGLPWAILWLIIGLTILSQAGKMKSSGRLFHQQR